MTFLSSTVLLGSLFFAAPKPVVKSPAIGSWSGHLVNVHWAPPKTANKVDPKAIKQVEGVLSKVTIKLTISKDGNYTAVTTSGGKAQPPSHGKWKAKGAAVTLTPNDSSSEHEYGTLSKDGKKITFTLPVKLTQAGVTGSAVFSKAHA